MPDFNADCKIAGCERESVDSSGYCKKHKLAGQLEEAKAVLAKQRELWMMVKDQLDAYDDGIPRVRFTDFHRPIERIDFFLGMIGSG